MKKAELYVVFIPLIVWLSAISFYEIKTGRILNLLVLPACIYFLVCARFVGSKPWWHYLVGALSCFAIFLLAGFVFHSVVSLDLFGGGTIKLAAAVGAVLGIQMVFIFFGIVIALMTLGHLIIAKIFSVEYVPSAPLFLFALMLTYWIRFKLFSFPKRIGEKR